MFSKEYYLRIQEKNKTKNVAIIYNIDAFFVDRLLYF